MDLRFSLTISLVGALDLWSESDNKEMVERMKTVFLSMAVFLLIRRKMPMERK